MLARVSSPLGFDHLKGRQVSIYARKWLAHVLTSCASSWADVANLRFQTMNVWTLSPTFIVSDHFVSRIIEALQGDGFLSWSLGLFFSFVGLYDLLYLLDGQLRNLGDIG
jgi:hypothetical protein